MQDRIPPAVPAELLSLQTLPGNYTRLVLRTGQSLPSLKPGGYCRLSNGGLSIRAPVMGVNDDIIECLYRNRNAEHLPDTLQNHGQLIVSLEGDGWNLAGGQSHIVFLTQNEGLACVVHAASRLHSDKSQKALTAFLEFDNTPPFTPRPSQILLPGAPPEALACVPLLEDWGIASRLADPGDHRISKPGWFSGTAVRLAEMWFEKSAAENCLLACCGLRSFVDAVLNLAEHWRMPMESTVLPESGDSGNPG